MRYRLVRIGVSLLTFSSPHLSSATMARLLDAQRMMVCRREFRAIPYLACPALIAVSESFRGFHDMVQESSRLDMLGRANPLCPTHNDLRSACIIAYASICTIFYSGCFTSPWPTGPRFSSSIAHTSLNAKSTANGAVCIVRVFLESVFEVELTKI